MKRRIFIVLLVLGLCVGTASAQFGFGIVYEPSNYANAVLRYLKPYYNDVNRSYFEQLASGEI